MKVVMRGAVVAALVAVSAPAVRHYYCKYCGRKTMSVNSLTTSLCQRHHSGPQEDSRESALYNSVTSVSTERIV